MSEFNAIRWQSGSNIPNNEENFQKIASWWEKLNGKNVQQHHIIEMNIDRATGLWQTNQKQPSESFKIQNPKLEDTTLSFIDQSGSHSIQAICIDLYYKDQWMMVWTPSFPESYIFTMH